MESGSLAAGIATLLIHVLVGLFALGVLASPRRPAPWIVRRVAQVTLALSALGILVATSIIVLNLAFPGAAP